MPGEGSFKTPQGNVVHTYYVDLAGEHVRASPGKALSEPLVEDRRCTPVLYGHVDGLNESLMPEGIRLSSLPSREWAGQA